MALSITDYRGYRISLLSSDTGHSALVHKSGLILGFARSSRKEGVKMAFRKALTMVDEAFRQGLPPQAIGRLQR
jgi:hypothetical protein